MPHKLHHVLILLRSLIRDSATSDLIFGNGIRAKRVASSSYDTGIFFNQNHISWVILIGKSRMYEGKIEPSLLYVCEVWTLKVHERKRMEAVEVNCSLVLEELIGSRMWKLGEYFKNYSRIGSPNISGTAVERTGPLSCKIQSEEGTLVHIWHYDKMFTQVPPATHTSCCNSNDVEQMMTHNC